jgi:formylglycine-generating enzyme required for sulfatase activity
MTKNWAICIGINDYYNLKPLQYAVQDAVAIRDFFLKEVNFEQVFYFSDDSPAIDTPRGSMRSLPTYANLKRFFRERFQKPFLNVGDNFWFFFAGHGELHAGHDYLMPIDVDPGNVEETALRISDITAYLRNSGADNTVLLLDACRSQGRRGPVGVGSEDQPGMVTIYSCSPRESSYEIEELEHGAFTYALLAGFRLQGSDNCATVERLDKYLCDQVPSLNARHHKPPQTPYTIVEPLSKKHLILLPNQATAQDVLVLKSVAQNVELEKKELEFSQQLWVRVLAASKGEDQEAIAAIQRIAQTEKTPSLQLPEFEPILDRESKWVSVLSPSESKPTVPTFEFETVTVNDRGSIIDRSKGSAEYRREDLGGGIFLDLVRVPEGHFLMGSPFAEGNPDEKPQHQVSVKSFWMSKYQVTQAQWRAVAALPKLGRDLVADPARFKGDNRPVEKICWDDAVKFCRRLSRHSGRMYSLPSEAKWEYACRAGTTTPFHFGKTITTDLANYRGTDWQYKGSTYSGFYGEGPRGEFRQQTMDVGSFPPNAFGLHDMHGNVWEWCLDLWHENYEGAPTDDRTWSIGEDSFFRVLRGGSWGIYPDGCRSADRYKDWSTKGDFLIGFRVVCVSAWTL